MRNRIQKILGSGRHDSPLRAEGAITRMDTRFRLELVVHVGDTTGTRNLAAKSCEDLAGAAAVEIALLVHSVEAGSQPPPSAIESPTVTAPNGSDTTGTTASTRTDALSSRETKEAISAERVPEVAKSEPGSPVQREGNEEAHQPETGRTWRILVQAPAVAVSAGPLPDLSVGFALSLGLEYELWQLQLQGIAWQQQNIPAPGLPGYGADVDRIGAHLGACHETRFSWFGFSPCLTAGMERVSATATGTHIAPSQQRALLVSVGAAAQGRVHLASWLRLLATVAGEMALVRPDLQVRGLGALAPPPDGDPPDPPTSIYRFAPATLTATLSLEWAL